MIAERWRQIRNVLEKALELPPGDRSAYLHQACSSDLSLRQEVEALLASSEKVRSSFLQSPPSRIPLTSGTKLGDYEVKSMLGAGGMGEVYRARDARLGRDVAIKVLPALLSADTDRLRRFEQEARAAAALNHPNILAVFQMGTYEGAPYLVSELLEGETLREQIKRGRLSIRKAIDYGMQIARGLAAAHEKGIVHRDLKPENLFATKDGRVKILDFGLAKLTQPEASSNDDAPTVTEGTEPGVVMGTVGYMAPEQVRGQTVDHRADIFAFGTILYEMLAGKRAFQKPTAPETMAAILNEDPPGISQDAASVPPALQRMVHRCLEKNPEQRFQSASDLAFALGALPDSPAPRHAPYLAIRARFVGYALAAIMLAFLIAGGIYYRSHTKNRLTDKDTVLLTDFANSTGDAIFDGALKTALSVSLRQSPFLSLVPDSVEAKALQLMARPADSKLTPEAARELCQRVGSKAYIAGAIGSLGSKYVLELKAVNCASGDTLAEEQITAKSKEEVLDALGEAASKLRGELGESLATVQRFDVPLRQAMTSSLEALKAYSLGRKVMSEKGAAASLPYYQRSIELDPNFATGFWAVGNMFYNLGEMARGNEYQTKAFQLRGRASEPEKLIIAATYYQLVTGELGKAEQTYREEIETYPREADAYGQLANVLAMEGQYDKGGEFILQALRLSPEELFWYENLAGSYVVRQRFDEARRVIRETQMRKMDDYGFHVLLYVLAFIDSDSAAMGEQQQWFAARPEYKGLDLRLASETETYAGRISKGLDLMKAAAESSVKDDDKETAGVLLAIAAQWQAAYGNAAAARQSATLALRFDPTSRGVQAEAALAFAMAGDAAQARSLAQDLDKSFPLDTQMQSLWLPAIRAQLSLGEKNAAASLASLQAAYPVELAYIGYGGKPSCLYHVYVRGEAYLAAGQGAAAAAEFQKIIDHSSIVWNCWTGALAHLGVARANALQSRTSQGADSDAARLRALAAYKDFLTLWEDADPDVPILKQAKAEYAKLQ
jgi:eukaryotic-like serine/threonine-protein kinase